MSDDQGQTQVYHRIETGMTLGTPDPIIEVYGDGANGWYEWRLTSDGKIEQESRDAGYGNPDVALRDALIHVYGPPDVIQELDRAIGRAQRGDPQPR